MTNETGDFPILSSEAAGSLSLADVPVVTGTGRSYDGEDNMDTVGLQQISLEDPEQPASSYEGASLPNPDDLPSSPKASSSTRKRFRCLSATACLLVIFFVIFAIGMTLRPADEPSSSSSSASTSSARPSHQQVIAFLLQHNVSSADSLTDPKSLQYVAAQHLAEIDPGEVPLPVETSNDHYAIDVYKYTTRYVMVLLYMAFQGPRWTTQHQFMTPLDVCEWNGISFSFDNPTVMQPGGAFCDPVSGLITKLDLEWNSLKASQIPTELGLLKTLEYLDLEYNGQFLKGTVPTEICHLQQLNSLGMRGNGFHGKIPTCMGRMHKLQNLLLGDNQLTGEIPTQLCELSNLQVLSLHRNLLEGNIPDCWGSDANKHLHLESIYLFDNNLEGPMPSSFAHIPSLTELFLDQNGLWNNPLPILDKMTQLEYLYLDMNQFSGTLDHTFLRQATKLKALDVSGNRFTSEVFPTHFFKYPDLKIIDLSENELKGTIPDNIPLNNVTTFFSVYDNKLKGQIPERISNLQSLQHLDVSYNYFNGSFPTTIFQMSTLTHFFISANPDLDAGPVPAELQYLTALTELSFKFSNRTGTLPDITALSNLVYLALDNNRFHGTIPAHYGSAPELQYLVLNSNPNLNGTVPSFASATKLVTAFFDGTKLSGDLESVCSLPVFETSIEERMANAWVFMANCGADKALTCSCCHCCSPEETDNATGTCSDLAVDTLDLNWEDQYVRTARDDGFNGSKGSGVVSKGGDRRA